MVVFAQTQQHQLLPGWIQMWLPVLLVVLLIYVSTRRRRAGGADAGNPEISEGPAGAREPHDRAYAPMPEAPEVESMTNRLQVPLAALYLVMGLTGVALGLGWPQIIIFVLFGLWWPVMTTVARTRRPSAHRWTRLEPWTIPPLLTMLVLAAVASALKPAATDSSHQALPVAASPTPTCGDLRAQLSGAHETWSVRWAKPANGTESVSSLMPIASGSFRGPEAFAALRELGPGEPKDAVAAASTGYGTDQARLVVAQFASQDEADAMVRWVVRRTCAGYNPRYVGDDVYRSDREGVHVRMAERGRWVIVSFGPLADSADTLITVSLSGRGPYSGLPSP